MILPRKYSQSRVPQRCDYLWIESTDSIQKSVDTKLNCPHKLLLEL